MIHKLCYSKAFGHSALSSCSAFKGILHPQIKNLSSFIYPHAVPDEYDFRSSVEPKQRFLEKYSISVSNT